MTINVCQTRKNRVQPIIFKDTPKSVNYIFGILELRNASYFSVKSKTPNERFLHHWPSTGEVDRIPTKELLVVRIANRRVDIMIVKNRAKIRVVKDAPAKG